MYVGTYFSLIKSADLIAIVIFSVCLFFVVQCVEIQHAIFVIKRSLVIRRWKFIIEATQKRDPSSVLSVIEDSQPR